MGKFFISLFCIFSMTFGMINADEAADKVTITNILTEFGTNLSNNDFKTVSTYFTFNADMIDPWGRNANGKEKVIDLLKTDTANNYSGDFFRFYLNQIRFLTSDICLVDAAITVDGQTKDIDQASIVFVRQNKEWKILALRWFRFLEVAQSSLQPNTSPDTKAATINTNKAPETTTSTK